MDVAVALLLAIVGGHQFVESSRFLRYVSAREDGHRLYFRAAFWGALLFAAVCIVLYLGHIAGHALSSLGDIEHTLVAVVERLVREGSKSDRDAQASVLIAAVLAMCVARPVAAIANRLDRRSDEEALYDALQFDPMERLLLDASLEAKQLLVTLASGKVYVGYPVSTPEPKHPRKALDLLPMMSGYRSDDHAVRFTTFYDVLYERGLPEDDFRIAIALDKVVSVAFFDVATYEHFKDETLPVAQV